MFQELFPILTTGDLPRALGFYRDLLGFQVTYQFPPEGEPGYVALYCDATVEHLRGHGVPVLAEPADQPWGERMAEVADPDGNRVIVASRG
jgi:lactoylglutathione lyase